MAGSLNKVTLIGHLGADPESKSLNSGASVVNFSIATTESWKDKNTGEKKERTEWHRIVVWNEGLGGVAMDYLRKGSKCYVEGQLQTRKWEKDGQDHYSTEVVLSGFGSTLILLGEAGGRNGGQSSGGNGGGQQQRSNQQPQQQQQRKPAVAGGGGGRRGDMDDEIPF